MSNLLISKPVGLRNFSHFEKNLVTGSFSKIYIFIDGSFLKKRGKLYYRKVKKLGDPVVVLTKHLLDNIPEVERRVSIAEDINQDLIWIQKTKNNTK